MNCHLSAKYVWLIRNSNRDNSGNITSTAYVSKVSICNFLVSVCFELSSYTKRKWWLFFLPENHQRIQTVSKLNESSVWQNWGSSHRYEKHSLHQRSKACYLTPNNHHKPYPCHGRTKPLHHLVQRVVGFFPGVFRCPIYEVKNVRWSLVIHDLAVLNQKLMVKLWLYAEWIGLMKWGN